MEFIMSDTKSYKIVYQLNENQKEHLHELYKKEWWCRNRTRKDVDDVLNGSSFIIGITESETDTLVGFTRILTDDFKYAYVYDVIVANENRGQGLGHMLLDAVVNHPRIKDLKHIELTCAETKKPFYERYGFSKDYLDSIPMRRANLDAPRS